MLSDEQVSLRERVKLIFNLFSKRMHLKFSQSSCRPMEGIS